MMSWVDGKMCSWRVSNELGSKQSQNEFDERKSACRPIRAIERTTGVEGAETVEGPHGVEKRDVFMGTDGSGCAKGEG